MASAVVNNALELEMPANIVILKRPSSFLKDLPHFHSLEQLLSMQNEYSSLSYLNFENAICQKDIKFVLHKMKELKKKKFKRVINGCTKVLSNNANYFWAHMINGAACRNYEKHVHDTPFYFSQAVLINPNCLTSWMCLLKYYRNQNFIDNCIFESIFSAILHSERNIEMWNNIVSELLENSSGIFVPLRKPLKLLAPFINYSENDKMVFLCCAISDYLFKHCKEKRDISDISVGFEAFKVYHIFYPHDDAFAKKVLSYLFCFGDFKMLVDFLQHVTHIKRIQDIRFEGNFFLKIMSFLPLIGINFTNVIMHEIMKVYRRKVNEIRKKVRTRLPQICCSYGDFGTAYELYKVRKKKMRKGQRLKTREIITASWAYIAVGNWKKVCRILSRVTKRMAFKSKKKEYKNECKRKVLKKNILNIWLHILTHGPSKETRKLGVLLALKLLNNNQMSVDVLFYACVGCIGLNMEKMAVTCLLYLTQCGAINEIIYLKSLLENVYPTKIQLLNEVSEFVPAQKLKAVYSCFFEKESKAFKSICKASINAPGCIFLYEWLGLFFHEKENYTTAEKYFEVALFYNSQSWTSIQYYPSLVAMHDIEASKIFLDLYRRGRKFHHSRAIAFRAGLQYLTLKTEQMDYFKAAENLMYGYRLAKKEEKRYFIELIGEAFSLFGMFGCSKNWFSECFIMNNILNIYAGSQLAKQYLFLRGVNKYYKHMRKLVQRGGLNTFICLHNAAHAFLLKSIRFRLKKKHLLSQIYCQKSLILCVRSLTISSNFTCTWKLLGDIFYECGSLTISSGFLYIPDWLLPECSSPGKIVLIRRFQSLLLAIRCYYNGFSTSITSAKMKACLWNSIAVAYKKASTFCTIEGRRKCLYLGMGCSLKALKERIKDSLSWNTLGILLKHYYHHNKEEVFQYSYSALYASMKIREIAVCRLMARGNCGFLCLWKGDIIKACRLFLDCRGCCTSLDYPWVGQMMVNLLWGVRRSYNYLYIRFIYEYTKHIPKIQIVFFFLSYLGQFYSKTVLRHYGRIYRNYCECPISTFKEYLLSFLLKIKPEKYSLAKLDLFFALRTVNGLEMMSNATALEYYYNALNELLPFVSQSRIRSALLQNISQNSYDLSVVYSLCTRYIKDGHYSNAYYELLKSLSSESHPANQAVLYLALACISFEKGAINDAKYYFHKVHLLRFVQRRGNEIARKGSLVLVKSNSTPISTA